MFRVKAGKALVLCAFFVFFLSCTGKQKTSAGLYTYHTTSGGASTWSPTDWQLNPEGVILGYTVSTLYNFVMNESKDGHEIVCEMAADFPVDVTTEYAGKSPYNVPKDATEGWAFRISLNKNAKWEDGTPITARDYEYSLMQFINPNMKNYRSTAFTKDGIVIANAASYYAGGASYENVLQEDGSYADAKDSELFTSLTQGVAFFAGESLEATNGRHPDYFTASDGTNLYEALEPYFSEHTYIPLTDEIKDILLTISKAFGDENPLAYKEYCFTKTEIPQTLWSDVGFILNDDYTFTVVLAKAYTPFMAMYNLSLFYLIKKDLYEANKKQTGDIVKSSYGTSKEKYASYGPYKIASYQAEKSIQLEKNEAWYGWTDGARHHNIQTMGIDIQFIIEHATILNLFLQGKLDDSSLDSTDLERYGNSEYRDDEPQTYTAKLSFNIDKAALERENSAGVNHTLIAYRDFRHAFSLCLDRRRFIDTVSPTNEPGYGIINNLYIADPATGQLYRNTPQAEATLCHFYGTDKVEDITGYDKDEAKRLFAKAYNEALNAGDIKASDTVQIDVHIVIASPANVRTISFLQESVNAATEGTGLEGKVRFNQVIDEDYYGNMKKGNVDLAFTLWGGNSFNPYGVLSCYCDPDVVKEYGFHPDKEKVTLNIEGQNLTKTYYDWYIALNQGEYSNAPYDIRNSILAGIEYALLDKYNMIPYRYMFSTSLHSQRIINGSDHYINTLVGFGGIHFMRYSMDDAEWEAYCKKNHNQLTY